MIKKLKAIRKVTALTTKCARKQMNIAIEHVINRLCSGDAVKTSRAIDGRWKMEEERSVSVSGLKTHPCFCCCTGVDGIAGKCYSKAYTMLHSKVAL